MPFVRDSAPDENLSLPLKKNLPMIKKNLGHASEDKFLRKNELLSKQVRLFLNENK